MEWVSEMRRMAAAKELVRENDVENLWRYEMPRSPASQDRLQEVSLALGHGLDSEYASFLLQADGWPAIMQDVDLFGTEELMGPSMDMARELVETLEPEGLANSQLDRDALLPIAASTTTIDFFVMPVVGGGQSAPVIWIAGAEVERYSSFTDFFRAMIEENISEAGDLRSQNNH
ncbi:SMI1/KNR4 family protein [Streptomyces sp. BPTC-684]|uniref:SMI1/KNR4 family protein n=1 Tax=Streptomyces sp. BPTC-684 TaxID=3043734 RepID=UPI0024B117E1|nr:SMI1/KNR4 family protein [Streptomyces sp. BPTC-684]WHM37542.1 SMI1/KNR4 family protein [Streptomyces sp. BPTC-684]